MGKSVATAAQNCHYKSKDTAAKATVVSFYQ